MKIDEIDFTLPNPGRLLSDGEWDFFYTFHSNMPSTSRDYLDKLRTYKERFNAHMPIPIRKELLRDMAE